MTKTPYRAFARPNSDGMALIAVLWLVAALSLMVTGVSAVVRQQTHIVSLGKNRVQATAQGDAALAIVLQKLAATPEPVRQWTEVPVTYAGQNTMVTIMPLSGLININGASLPLLAALLQAGGGLPEGAAQELAIAILDRRQRTSEDGRRPERFEAIEDLMQTPGVDYDLYARLAPFITASSSTGAAVDPLAAPPHVLMVLAGGNASIVNQIMGQRASGQPSVDMSGLDGALARVGSSQRRYRLTARVPLPDGSQYLVERDVYFSGSARGGLPWYTFESRQMMQPSAH